MIPQGDSWMSINSTKTWLKLSCCGKSLHFALWTFIDDHSEVLWDSLRRTDESKRFLSPVTISDCRFISRARDLKCLPCGIARSAPSFSAFSRKNPKLRSYFERYFNLPPNFPPRPIDGSCPLYPDETCESATSEFTGGKEARAGVELKNPEALWISREFPLSCTVNEWGNAWRLRAVI